MIHMEVEVTMRDDKSKRCCDFKTVLTFLYRVDTIVLERFELFASTVIF
jgi:hypothetical protein